MRQRQVFLCIYLITLALLTTTKKNISFSALDSVSEAAIQEAMQTISQHRTVLTIAHRLSTIRNAQQIIVVGDSKILEQGSYDELMGNRTSIFRDLVKQQTFETTPTSHVFLTE